MHYKLLGWEGGRDKIIYGRPRRVRRLAGRPGLNKGSPGGTGPTPRVSPVLRRRRLVPCAGGYRWLSQQRVRCPRDRSISPPFLLLIVMVPINVLVYIFVEVIVDTKGPEVV